MRPEIVSTRLIDGGRFHIVKTEITFARFDLCRCFIGCWTGNNRRFFKTVPIENIRIKGSAGNKLPDFVAQENRSVVLNLSAAWNLPTALDLSADAHVQKKVSLQVFCMIPSSGSVFGADTAHRRSRRNHAGSAYDKADGCFLIQEYLKAGVGGLFFQLKANNKRVRFGVYCRYNINHVSVYAAPFEQQSAPFVKRAEIILLTVRCHLDIFLMKT